MGGYFVQELVKNDGLTVTALVREGFQGELPEGVKTAPISYDNEESLVAALQGQQFLVITLSVRAPPDSHTKLVNAAAKAGVPFVMPNSYGFDVTSKFWIEDSQYGAQAAERAREVERAGVSSWIWMACGFWYEWSLAMGDCWYGFDIKQRKVTFYDDGKTVINTSTWDQCARALAALLKLKVLPDDENDKSATISDWKNKPLYISSFSACQRDMLDSIHRVIGTTDKDWDIQFQPSEARYKQGLEELQKGQTTGYAKSMYAHAFFPHGDSHYEKTKGLDNSKLNLPKEDLDEITKNAIEMAENDFNAKVFQQLMHQ